MTLRELMEKRARLVAEMRALNDTPEGEAGDLSETQHTKFTELRGNLKKTDEAIERQKLIDEADRRADGEAIAGDSDQNFDLECRSFSLARAIAGAAGMEVDNGREREVSAELNRRNGGAFKGVAVPMQVFEKRVVTTAAPVGGPGGNIIATDFRGDQFIDILRAKLLTQGLGATVLSGLQGNVDIPRLKASATTGWVAENAAISASDHEFDKVSMAPKHVGAITEFSRNMLLQSTPDIEQLIRSDFAFVLAQALDAAALVGGGSNEPDGLIAAGIDSSVSMATPSWGKVLDLINMVEEANASLCGNFGRGATLWGLLSHSSHAAPRRSQTLSGDGVMGLLRKIADRLDPPLEMRARDKSWEALAGAQGEYTSLLSGEKDRRPAITPRLAETLATVLACVNAIGGAISSLPVWIYQLTDEGREVAKTHAVTRMVREGPNRYQSWPEFIEWQVASVLLNGNALAEIVTDRNGRATALMPIFGTTYAALAWAHQNDEIDQMPPKLRLPSGGRREFVATPSQLASLWDELASDHMRIFFVLCLSTAGRKSAVLDLTRFQCDLERGLIDLNPVGRTQNKKRRATVPMTKLARAWIEQTTEGHLVTWRGKQLSDIKNSWNAARERAELPKEFTPHTLRHTVASWCRMQSVDSWRTSALGGWREPGADTVERYAKFDPEYFQPVIDALDGLFVAIASEAKTSLNPTHRASNVRDIWKIGAGDEIRTHDLNLGKVSLYP